MLFILLWLVLTFAISWSNAYSTGRYWSESKQIGGLFRANVIAGYVMSIIGFTMVYGYIILMLLPYVLPHFMELSQAEIEEIMLLSDDLLFLLVAATIIPTGFIIWFQSFKTFWERKNIANGMVAGWNSYAQIKNLVTVSRHAPSALGRIVKALFGGKSKKKDGTILAIVLIVVILAICGGWLTASAIRKNADEKYDAFERFGVREY